MYPQIRIYRYLMDSHHKTHLNIVLQAFILYSAYLHIFMYYYHRVYTCTEAKSNYLSLPEKYKEDICVNFDFSVDGRARRAVVFLFWYIPL